MHFLADESCDFAVVRRLRAEGHDVVAVAELSPRSADEDVMRLARDDERILLTEDKDFGRLIYADALATGGVILIRYSAAVRASLTDDVVHVVRTRGRDLVGRFVVLKPGRVRVGPRRP